jgi:hypothetical protein
LLNDDAQLGLGSNDWACTKDNKSGLIWEVKTIDGGLRDMNNVYTWYEPDMSKNAGSVGTVGKNQDDTFSYASEVNKTVLCGAKNWRLPTKEELMGLISCPNSVFENSECKNWGTYDRLVPTISKTYFPNTQASWYWTSSVAAGNPYNFLAWAVYFNYGSLGSEFRSRADFVRLVH